jgi:hypothetical protein
MGDLIRRAADSVGFDDPWTAAGRERVVVDFGRVPASAVADQFAAGLAELLDVRNVGLDLLDRLRVVATVSESGRDVATDAAGRLTGSPLLARVRAAAPGTSLVIVVPDASSRAVGSGAGYSHVRCGRDGFWIRVPGRVVVPGLVPADLVTEPRRPPGGSRVVVTRQRRAQGGDGDGRGGRGQAPGQTEELCEALIDAYPSFDELHAMLTAKLGRNLHRLASPVLRLDLVMGQVVGRARTEGWLGELVSAAFLGNPGNSALRKLVSAGLADRRFVVRTAISEPNGSVEEFLPQAGMLADLVDDGHGDAARPWSGTRLEKIHRTAAAFQDILVFTEKLLATAARVCRVEIRSSSVRSGGTGFLVGPDLVLTNHHVVRAAIEGDVAAGGVRCVFDHHVGPDQLVRDGEVVELAGDGNWLVSSSPPSALDDEADPIGVPTAVELDYALLRLARPAGATTTLDGRERGWMCMTGSTTPVVVGLPLLIVQHPLEFPMKLAVDPGGVASVNANRTRLTHRVNTEAGSSGSPCLTFDLDLVALHHSGRARHNEAIPIATIADDLRAAGHAALLDI